MNLYKLLFNINTNVILICIGLIYLLLFCLIFIKYKKVMTDIPKKMIYKKTLILISFATFAIILILVSDEISNFIFSNKSKNIKLFTSTIITYLGCCTFLFALLKIFNLVKSNNKLTTKSFLLCLPFILVALNNFPYASLIEGNLILEYEFNELILYIIMCILMCIFEELIFRRLIFLYLLDQAKNKKQQLYAILISSIIFSLSHLVNLIGGGSILTVLIQIGYSFLIGLMLCLVLLITRNISLCIIIHSVYNILGMSINYFSRDYQFDIVTIIITIIISIFAFIWGIFVFIKYPYELKEKQIN